MIDKNIEMTSPVELQYKSIVSRLKQTHAAFNKTVWSSQIQTHLAPQFPLLTKLDFSPAFHDEYHIDALIAAAKPLVDEAIRSNGKIDPLGLLTDLNSYNQRYNNNITKEEMKCCIEIALAGHDIGDIQKIENDQIRLFTDGYHPGKGSEKRSEEIMKKFLDEEGVDPRHIRFITYLIGETQYNKPDVKPFALFMRLIDFVGNGYFSKNENRFLGLLLEEINLLNKDDTAKLARNLHDWCNMVPGKFEDYLPGDENKEKRKKIEEIWRSAGGKWEGVNQLPFLGELPKKEVLVASWLRNISMVPRV